MEPQNIPPQTPSSVSNETTSNFSSLKIIGLGLLILLGGLTIGFYFGRISSNQISQSKMIIPTEKPTGVSCTLDVKLCPDGSSVGRIGPNCEFSPCPEVKSSPTKETYTNTKYGFSLNYSPPATIEEDDNPGGGQFRVFISEKVTLDIQPVKPPLSFSYLGTKLTSKATINENVWDIGENQGYCDAGECGDPFVLYQTVRNNYRYAFISSKNEDETELLSDLLSTFKFLSQ